MARVINRFREKVSVFNFPQIGKVTVSAGYTEIQALDSSALLIDRADAALYFAKNNTRNSAHYYEHLVATGQLKENKLDGDVELF
jgi:GGDEF domain-containing protein